MAPPPLRWALVVLGGPWWSWTSRSRIAHMAAGRTAAPGPGRCLAPAELTGFLRVEADSSCQDRGKNKRDVRAAHAHPEGIRHQSFLNGGLAPPQTGGGAWTVLKVKTFHVLIFMDSGLLSSFTRSLCSTHCVVWVTFDLCHLISAPSET